MKDLLSPLEQASLNADIVIEESGNTYLCYADTEKATEDSLESQNIWRIIRYREVSSNDGTTTYKECPFGSMAFRFKPSEISNYNWNFAL